MSEEALNSASELSPETAFESAGTQAGASAGSPAVEAGFIDIFLGTLVCPVKTFELLASDCKRELKRLPSAAIIVTLVFSLDALRLTPPKQLYWALLNVPSELVGGLLLWLFSAGLVSLTALCFGQPVHKSRAAFVTLAWSLLPWIFMGPISCFAGALGPAHVLLMLVPFLWILLLQIIAIKASFDLKAWQVLSLVFLVPMILGWLQMMQFLQILSATLGSLL